MRVCAMAIMRGAPIMRRARIARIMGLMRRVRVMPVVPIVVRLSGRAGEAKGTEENRNEISD